MTSRISSAFSQAWYQATIDKFLTTDVETVLGFLSSNSEFDVSTVQRDAWQVEILCLRKHLSGLVGTVLLEFNIPRLGRRVDAIVLLGPVVLVVEFKVGATVFDRSALDQVWDYALDLKNFHAESHAPPIVPILVATEAKSLRNQALMFDDDQVCRPLCSGNDDLRQLIELSSSGTSGATLNGERWATSPYKPTPTIVEAARTLYAQHSVEAIDQFDAGAKNLQLTSRRIEELIAEAKEAGRKLICFVTGVPGAGKTLVGLNIAAQHREKKEATYAVFLSGNGPLVRVLCEALTRDEFSRKRSLGEKVTKNEIGQKVKAFIQNVHHFRDAGLKHGSAPAEHVVIFDEAQRAWNLRQTASFMTRKKNRPGFSQSEPEFLISCMDRHQEWAVIVCLVGGGQEIHTGEAGIGEWLDALNTSFKSWHIYISSNLRDSEYAAGISLEKLALRDNVHYESDLHLAVSMRSFRAEHVSAFVKALLDCKVDEARGAYDQISKRYPIAVTRDLTTAKKWIRSRARGSERYGVVASSKALRLRPHALDIRVAIDPVQWFLNGRDDLRSSDFLEDAATEFQVQGLEVDWACVTWDGDLRFNGTNWSFHNFRGSKWEKISNAENQIYLRNAYRVLLTRARQGMVIFVPRGNEDDYTRPSAYYDPTYNYLVGLGIPVLE